MEFINSIATMVILYIECDEIWFENTRIEKTCWRLILATKYSETSIKDKIYTKLKLKVQRHSVESVKTHWNNKINNKTFDGESLINEELEKIKITWTLNKIKIVK